MDSGKLDGLVKKAERSRAQDARRHRRGLSIGERIERAWESWRTRPVRSDSFRAYWAIAPAGVLGLWPMPFWLSLMLAGLFQVIFGSESYGPWFVWSMIAVAVMTGTVIAIRYLIVILGYPSYRTWKTRLPFQLNGWERLFESRNPLSVHHWRLDSSIRFHFTPGSSAEAKTIDAILYLFCKEANGWFYEPDGPVAGFAGDPRTEWKVIGTEVWGSLNRGTITEIYRMLNQLAELQRKRNVLTSIDIIPGKNVAHVEPPSYAPNP